MKIELYGPIEGVTKSHALWAHRKGKAWPLMYFRRPKGVPEEFFNEIAKAITIYIDKDLLESLQEPGEGE